MSIENLKNQMPEYARDIKLNLSSLANEEILNPQQLWGTFLATALAGRNDTVIREIEAEAAQHLSQDALNAAKGAAAIMAMNNVYYKFTGLMEEYRTIPARLRMNILAKPGVEAVDFELWSLAVSAMNGCQFCVKSHEKKVREGGLSLEQVQTAVRIASVVQAASAVIGGEQAMGGVAAQAA
ncbi:MAG: carboxymuconolactone decarboxylase family protein [Alphaproteobacteria bacterium]|nr:carboxymuconolactone decarboxylase family protein [Alphaproteobacteria bacterium]